ncbi:alpha-N-acetylneuraminide alpha-2,8-sialyltransferase-like [Tachysurus fulvidraco]|uniref:alpha-N-acetylneuraminide alpha-2,8-sialyltransferase-like n=1 Tax=Tachysurus fulvidraco TaxID=1234273 RepID=UPI001FEE5871|nr:alpha-N-acetylneuraminide alpha-2,8-sialyltransferase-like [Tachysurus fulvidraco]
MPCLPATLRHQGVGPNKEVMKVKLLLSDISRVILVTGPQGIHDKQDIFPNTRSKEFRSLSCDIISSKNAAQTNLSAALRSSLNIKNHEAKPNDVAASDPDKVKQNPAKNNNVAASDPDKVKQNPAKSKSLLRNNSDAISNATVTQDNSPVGKKITYDGDFKRTQEVTPALFSLFPKESPFKYAPWDSCAVVGNGGIIANSSCGKQIDSSSYVIRCNLPPLDNGYERDTGHKTNLVTANPSIFFEKYHALNERRRSFVEDIQIYGDALLFLPAFSFRQNMAVSLRVIYAIEDININGPRPVFLNPEYLSSLAKFWRAQGIHSLRLSTGIMMVSLALELCNNVHLYGFWPFGIHPYTHQKLSNHYYDNRPVNKRIHAMPAEFKALLDLHNKGVIHLHLEECKY